MGTESFLNYIDGEFVPSANKNTFPKVNPFNGETFGRVSDSDAMDVVKAIQGAKKAFAEFSTWGPDRRAQLLEKIAFELESRADEISQLEALHQGLPFLFVKEKSLEASIAYFRKATADIKTKMKPEFLSLAQPTGLVSIIVSWNLSLRLVSERLAPALAAGNCCLVKVSEHSPVTAKIFGDLLTSIGAPKGLVQFVHGRGDEVGTLMASHPSIGAVTFVGRFVNAQKVAKVGASTFKKLQIYSGTKNSLFILDPISDPNVFPRILQSFLLGQGQLGWNTTRLFVLESAYKEFLSGLKKFFDGLSLATSPQDKAAWFPLITNDAVRAIEATEQQLLSEGAKVLLPKKESSGCFVRPVISIDLSNCSELQQQEVSGPLLIISAVKYQHEMVKWANTGFYGDSAVVWGQPEKAYKLADKLKVGTVSCNSWLPLFHGVGVGQSFFGNADSRPFGTFYSDVKILSGFEVQQNFGE